MAVFLDILTLCCPCGVSARAGLNPYAGKCSKNFIPPIFFITLASSKALWMMEKLR